MILRTLMGLGLGKRLPTLDGTIVVRRDENGVPYVEAQNDDDAFFAWSKEEVGRRARSTLHLVG